jgi:hypothetical protein
MANRDGVLTLGLVAALTAFGPIGALADDEWEVSGEGFADDDASTRNQLVHGGKQRHDAQGTGTNGTTRDFDWIRVATRVRHSYEARVSGSPMTFTNGTCGECGQFDRVSAGGAVLQASVAIDGTTTGVRSSHQVLRWIGTANQQEFLRVGGMAGFPTGPTDLYDIEFFDTTYFGPRFNQSGGQLTIVLIQNANKDIVPNAIVGAVYFYNAGGGLLATVPLAVPADGLQVISTLSIPALAGQSGAVTIAHTGGYGALAAKAVALEPATGFSFDTPFQPIPR